MESQEISRILKISRGISKDLIGSRKKASGTSRDLMDFKRSHGISRELIGSQGISRDLLRTHKILTIFTILVMLTKMDAMII